MVAVGGKTSFVTSRYMRLARWRLLRRHRIAGSQISLQKACTYSTPSASRAWHSVPIPLQSEPTTSGLRGVGLAGALAGALSGCSERLRPAEYGEDIWLMMCVNGDTTKRRLVEADEDIFKCHQCHLCSRFFKLSKDKIRGVMSN